MLAITLTFLLLALIAFWKRHQLAAWTGAAARFFSAGAEGREDGLGRLFWISFVALYVEIMLIRWIGTEVRVFAYFQNLALIACFLGFGLGCYWANRTKALAFSMLAILLLVVLVTMPVPAWEEFLAWLSTRLSLGSDAALWGVYEDIGWQQLLQQFVASVIVIAVFLLLLVAIMIPVGQWVGYYLDRAPRPMRAYSANLLGSVAGIWIFAGMSFVWLPPRYWFAVAVLLLALAPPASRRVRLTAAVVFGCLLALFSLPGPIIYWSPYQKLQITPLGENQYDIAVNNTGYMTIANTTPGFLAQHSEVETWRTRSSYDAPYRFAPRAGRVLVVGSGAGNDVAAALRNGAEHVDAVEIDPVILSLGKRLHPDQPYGSPKVTSTVNDARAFMRQTSQRYDVVMFGLLDSHTQFSDFSNMRVDNYVYTEEAFRQARRLLKPGGVLVLKFEVREPWTWMGERFAAMITHVFGRAPVVFYCPSVGRMAAASVFIASDSPALWERAAQPELAKLLSLSRPSFSVQPTSPPPATTDDWPYVYHRGHTIPQAYLIVSLVLLAIAFFSVRGVLEPRRASTWEFFFLGAGFLLLETQLISRLALYFGTTWIVNCVAITAILLVLVLANGYVARKAPARLGPYYALLAAFLAANYFFPWHSLPYGARTIGVLLSAAYAVPVFFAGVIFGESFRRQQQKSSAFGANIVGAVAGGLAQNLSFIVGMKALLLLAVVFYVSAAGFARARGVARAAAA